MGAALTSMLSHAQVLDEVPIGTFLSQDHHFKTIIFTIEQAPTH
jgi:hypothetical protein